MGSCAAAMSRATGAITGPAPATIPGSQIRHRSCLFPACHRPATDTQTDHRHDHAQGGPTLEPNLGPLCERHHDLKTRWGWRLIKRDDETYVWISPLGRRHLVTIEPVAPPLPDPPQPLERPDAA